MRRYGFRKVGCIFQEVILVKFDSGGITPWFWFYHFVKIRLLAFLKKKAAGGLALRNIFILSVAGVIFTFLSGCSNLTIRSEHTGLIPTEQIPTVIAMTVDEMVLRETSDLDSSTQRTLEPSPTNTMEIPPSITSTPNPEGFRIVTATKQSLATVTPVIGTNLPYADIQFISPGELSKVITPINLHAFLMPGDSGRATIELFGEDGRLMFRKLFVFTSPPGVQTTLRTDIDFEIAAVAETATLVISTEDSYGRMKSAASIKLILLSLGESDINPPGDHLAAIVVREPLEKVLIQGGKLMVSGLIRTDSELPLLVELVTTDGKVIGSRLAGIVQGGTGNHRLFATELAYTVETPTWIRVTISERKNGNSTPVQLTSVEVLLSP